MTGDIRALIREVLAEELQARRGGVHASAAKAEPREEIIAVPRGGDLTAFATGLLERAKDAAFAADIRTGRLRFRAAGVSSAASEAPTAAGPGVNDAPTAFEKGLITEKYIAALPEGSIITVTEKVKFTPLAMDELRRRRIRMERKPQ